MGRIKDETIRGAKWNIVSRCTMQPVQFLFGIILARLISPEEMGILGLTAIFFAIAGQLKDCGFGAALIRKQDRTEADCSTMFWFNVVASFTVAAILFALAPWFASFYAQPDLLPLTRVSAVMLFLNSTSSVHWCLYSARRDFKTPAIVGIVSTLFGMPICIFLAYNGWSYWSLVIQGIASGLLSLIIVWFISPWKPRFLWSWKSFRQFFGFGSKLAATGMLQAIYDNSRTFIIGKFYTPAQLANFSKGFQLCHMPINVVLGTVSSVTYPILATIQDDEERLNRAFLKYISVVSVGVCWGMLTLAFLCKDVVLFLYGAKWEECATYAQIFVFGAMFGYVTNINTTMYMVRGRSDINLKREIIIRTFGLFVLFAASFYGVRAICWSATASGIFTVVISMWFSARISTITVGRQILCFAPYLLYALLANAPAFFLRPFFCPIINLCVFVPLSLFVYCGILYYRRDEAGADVYEMIISKIKILTQKRR